MRDNRTKPGGLFNRTAAMMGWRAIAAMALAILAIIGSIAAVAAATTSNVRATRHNLSSSNVIAGSPVKATTENQVCVFCHTPHGANTAVKPLWNRSTNASGTYIPYTSSSLDATAVRDALNGVTGGSSVLCLSCHDGTIALGNVMVLNGSARDTSAGGSGDDITLLNTGLGGIMPSGSGATTGDTRLIGSYLGNDHPISITYDHDLALADGELRDLDASQKYPAVTGAVIGIPSTGYRPLLPLAPTGTSNAGQVQCATCHDPHITNEKFLRLNRFQANNGPGTSFNEADDIICLACHTKLGNTWAQSAHADKNLATYVYAESASTARGFPLGKKVWEVSCLNCHDTHTASGSRRLLREGTGSAPNATPGSLQAGSTTLPAEKVSSIENTCYQCHTTAAASILTSAAMTETTGVPNIKTEFERLVHMPIKTSEQLGTGNNNDKEVHDILSADFTETQAKLGLGFVVNRHAECTDCHNPHRVIKNALFNGLGSTTRRTHVPSASTATELNGSGGNIASGVLRGAWGVEPSYTAAGQTTVTVSGTGSSVTGTKWPENPTFEVKKGDPGVATSAARTATYLTREYQLCFKCHSNYANSDIASSFPTLGNTGGGTAYNTNSMTRYTNVAAEFAVRATDPPTSGNDQGEVTNSGTKCGGGDCAPVGSYPRGLASGNGEVNHRSWHPVVFPTGRDRAERSMGATGVINMRPPWETNIGSQTMQCSDCHGNSASYTQYVGPVMTEPQGPHGSDTPFLLKGTWNTSVKLPSPSSDSLCGKCHNPGANSSASGYGGDHIPDDKMGGEPCMYCHIAVPHGWKNKAFLANLRCVGQEVEGTTGDCANRGSGTYGSTTIAPYYISTRLRISTWVRSGGWTSSACGGGTMEDNCPRTGD